MLGPLLLWSVNPWDSVNWLFLRRSINYKKKKEEESKHIPHSDSYPQAVKIILKVENKKLHVS
jgi:hypothetical protein